MTYPEITRKNLGPHRETFMCTRSCPSCGFINEDMILVPDVDYMCYLCYEQCTYRAPRPRRKPPRRPSLTEVAYEYIIKHSFTSKQPTCQ